MRIPAISLAAALLALPQVAAAAETPCLTSGEITALATYALPSLIGSAARTCAATLPAGAWLPAHGSDLAQRYSAGRAQAWPSAKAAFLRLSAASNPEAAALFTALPDSSLMPVADAALAGIIAAKLKPDSCPTIDRAISLIAPLPAENAAELIAIAAGIGAKAGEARLGKFAICKA